MNELKKIRKIILKYYKENNQFPKIDYISELAGIKYRKVIAILRKFEKTGFLKRNYNQYIIDSSYREKNIKKVIPIIVIRIAMLFIGIFAAYMSIYYTANWLFEFLHPVLSIILSGTMILFSIIAFEMIIILFGRKQFAISSIFIFLWVIVLIFSMVSTVAGQYNQRMANFNEKIFEKKDKINKNSELESYNIIEADLVDRMNYKKQEYDTLNNLLSEFDTLEKRKKNSSFFWDTYKRLKVAEQDLKKIDDRLNEIRKKKLDNVLDLGVGTEASIENWPPFYSWLGGILDVRPDFVEFWMSVFPAIFIDLIAPLALAISMFLNGGNLFYEK